MSEFLVPFPDGPTNPSLVFRRTDYFRDSASTGRDLTWEVLGDFKVSRSGDFETIEGADLVTQALLRALYTPEYGYRRWVRTATGPVEVDSTYGNKAYRYLSQPSSPRTPEKVRDAVFEAASNDPRINVQQVTVFPDQLGRLRLQMTYTIKGAEDLKNLDLVLKAP